VRVRRRGSCSGMAAVSKEWESEKRDAAAHREALLSLTQLRRGRLDRTAESRSDPGVSRRCLAIRGQGALRGAPGSLRAQRCKQSAQQSSWARAKGACSAERLESELMVCEERRGCRGVSQINECGDDESERARGWVRGCKEDATPASRTECSSESASRTDGDRRRGRRGTWRSYDGARLPGGRYFRRERENGMRRAVRERTGAAARVTLEGVRRAVAAQLQPSPAAVSGTTSTAQEQHLRLLSQPAAEIRGAAVLHRGRCILASACCGFSRTLQRCSAPQRSTAAALG
jgi:hypothetical protein